MERNNVTDLPFDHVECPLCGQSAYEYDGNLFEDVCCLTLHVSNCPIEIVARTDSPVTTEFMEALTDAMSGEETGRADGESYENYHEREHDSHHDDLQKNVTKLEGLVKHLMTKWNEMSEKIETLEETVEKLSKRVE